MKKEKIEISYIRLYVSFVWSFILMFIPSIVIFFRLKGKNYSYDENNLYVTEGIFTKNTLTVPLYRIGDLFVEEKILPYGTITVKDKSKIIVLSDISNPKQVYDDLHSAWEYAKDNKQVVRNEVF